MAKFSKRPMGRVATCTPCRYGRPLARFYWPTLAGKAPIYHKVNGKRIPVRTVN